jgi:hypothetical protein
MVNFQVPDEGTDYESEAQSEYVTSDIDITDLFEEATETMATPMQGLDPNAQQQNVDPATLMQNLQAIDPNDTAGRAQALDTIIAQILHQRVIDRNVIDRQAQTIQDLTTQLQNAQGKQGQPPVIPLGQPRAPREKEPGEIIKPPLPDKFEGDPTQIQKFFTDMRDYFRYFPITMANDTMRVRVAGGRLAKTAKNWFEPHLRDFEQTKEPKKQYTNELFASYAVFEERLEKLCGKIDEAKEAKNKLLRIKQTGACSKYTAAFIQAAARTDLNDDALRMLYYQGLKPALKDELYRDDLPNTFDKLSEKATRIDDRMFERNEEKKRENQSHKEIHIANSGKKKEYIASSNDGRPGRMDISTVNTRKFSGKCHNCGKIGHKEKDCYSKKDNRKPEFRKEQQLANKVHVNTVNPVPHAMLSWTGCYDDDCTIHKELKEASKYFPRAPRRKQPKKVTIATVTVKEQTQHYADNISDNGITDEDMAQVLDNLALDNDDKDNKELATELSPELTEDEEKHEQKILFELGEKTRQERLDDLDDFIYQENRKKEKKPYQETLTEFQQRDASSGSEGFPPDDKEEDPDMEPLNEVRQRLKDAGITQRWVPRSDGLTERANTASSYYYPVMTAQQFLELEEKQLAYDNPFTEDCHNDDIEWCSQPLCNRHGLQKVNKWQDIHSLPGLWYNVNCGENKEEDCNMLSCYVHLHAKVKKWHEKGPRKCTAVNPLHCQKRDCQKHWEQKHQYHELRRRLQHGRFDFQTHRKNGAYTRDIVTWHEWHIDDITTNKCQWCRKIRKQREKLWIPSDLDAIHEDTLVYDLSQQDYDKIHVDSVGATGFKKFIVKGILNQCPVNAYIDSGSGVNLVSMDLVKKMKLPYHKKERPLHAVNITDTDMENGAINYETDHLNLVIHGKTCKVKFDVLDMPSHDLVLGFPWLKDNDPRIRWATGQIFWDIQDDPEF